MANLSVQNMILCVKEKLIWLSIAKPYCPDKIIKDEVKEKGNDPCTSMIKMEPLAYEEFLSIYLNI